VKIGVVNARLLDLYCVVCVQYIRAEELPTWGFERCSDICSQELYYHQTAVQILLEDLVESV